MSRETDVSHGKPRTLIISRNLPPLQGGMERLNWHLVRELSQTADVAVCGPKGCGAALPFCNVAREAPVHPLSYFLIQNFFHATQLARTIRPNVIVAGSGLTVPTALAAARLCGAHVVGYLHGLDIIADNLVYRAIWRRSLRLLDAVIVNSRYTAELASDAGIPEKNIHLLHPGVELPALDPVAASEFRRRFGLEDRPLLLSVGRLTARKGLAEFVMHSLPMLVRQFPDLMLIVIGDDAVNALAARGQRERILAVAADAGISQYVKLLGPQPDEVLRGAYLASHALIFPVLELPGDVEGFGMVAVEAAAHGLPTVAFAIGGVSDAVSDPESGRLISAGNYAAMSAALAEYLAVSRSQADILRHRDFAARFAWPIFGERVRRLCENHSSSQRSEQSLET